MGVVSHSTIVYIDGFNFYYGVFKKPPFDKYKWLDMDACFTALLGHHQIVAIKYFSALVQNDAAASARQQAYWDALSTLPLTQIIPGNFKKKSVTCQKATCTFAGSRKYRTVEEKRTDVNIALSMIDDAYQGAAEQLVLVSGDSDLAPALHLIRQRFPDIRIVVYVPTANDPIRGKAPELRSLAHRARNFAINLVSSAQLPPIVTLANGTQVSKPTSW